MSSTPPSSTGWYPGKYIGRKLNNPSRNESSNQQSGSSPTSGSSAKIQKSSSSLIRSKPIKKSIGKISVESFGMKFLSSSRPTFQVKVENDLFSSSLATFAHTFNFSDISTEILITIIEEYSVTRSPEVVGQIVLPVHQYFSILKALSPKREWFMFLPVYKDWPAGRFRSSTEPGGGLNKMRQKIGFVELCITVELNSKLSVRSLYFRKPTPSAHVKPPRPRIESAVAEDWQRLYQVMKLPVGLGALLTMPEVFILVALTGFICMGASAWQIPLLFFSSAFLNGILSKTGRDPNKVVIWNDMVAGDTVDLSANTPPKAVPAQAEPATEEDLTLAGIAANHAHLLDVFVSSLERLANCLSFGDPKMTLICFGVLFGISIFSSILLSFISIRFFMFLLIGLILVVTAMLDQIQYFLVHLDFDTLESAGTNGSSATIPTRLADEDEFEFARRVKDAERDRAIMISTPNLFKQAWNILWGFYYFWNRLPDEPELNHRQIALISAVKNGGSEMEEAEEFFNKHD